MSPQNFKVFTFDVVGTLIDFEGGMPACLHPFLAHTVPDYHLHTLAGSADAVEAGR
jgi:FMN phosphatase YigB (HAD superfamily)